MSDGGAAHLLDRLDERAARRRLARRQVLLAAGSSALLAGCGAREAGPTLRVADQLKVLQAALAAAGEDKPAGYRIEWSNFFSGPPIIAAETRGSLDLGWMAETPTIFAQAARSPVKVVAVNRGLRPGASNIALVVGAASPIRTRLRLIREVVLPLALLSVLTGLRFALGASVLILIAAEQINASAGIGYLLTIAQVYQQVDVILICIAIYALLGLVADLIVRVPEWRLMPWRAGIAAR